MHHRNPNSRHSNRLLHHHERALHHRGPAPHHGERENTTIRFCITKSLVAITASALDASRESVCVMQTLFRVMRRQLGVVHQEMGMMRRSISVTLAMLRVVASSSS